MQISRPFGTWHAPKQNITLARLYLGVTSVDDLSNATHVSEAIIGPSLTGASASVAFGPAAPLPIMPKTVTLSGANAVFEDVPMAYLLSGGRVRMDTATTLSVHIEYDSNVVIDSVTVRADWRFPYVSEATLSVACGAFSETLIRREEDVAYPKKFNVNQTAKTLLVSLGVPAGEITLLDLLPITPVQTASLPDFGLLVDTETGSALPIVGITYLGSTPGSLEFVLYQALVETDSVSPEAYSDFSVLIMPVITPEVVARDVYSDLSVLSLSTDTGPVSSTAYA